MAEIRLENVAKAFGSFTAVNGVDLTVDHGAFFVILGPSGCGKTTTLRMTAGLELPTSGRILLDGEDVTALGLHGTFCTGKSFGNVAIGPEPTREACALTCDIAP